MKLSNPGDRYHLKIGKSEKVLEVGGGHNPHPRSNMVVDKFIDSNYHRQSDIKVLRHQQFMQADGENLPFADNEYDYVICNQVLEHVEDPHAFAGEQARVAKRGYMETPSLIGEYLFPKESHRWLILELDNKLVLMDKSKHWFKTGLDFGFIFLTWLQKNSLAWKMLLKTDPDLFTVRYEWKDSIDLLVDPDDEGIVKYFTQYWDEEMTRIMFPEKKSSREFRRGTSALCSVVGDVFSNKMKGQS